MSNSNKYLEKIAAKTVKVPYKTMQTIGGAYIGAIGGQLGAGKDSKGKHSTTAASAGLVAGGLAGAASYHGGRELGGRLAEKLYKPNKIGLNNAINKSRKLASRGGIAGLVAGSLGAGYLVGKAIKD